MKKKAGRGSRSVVDGGGGAWERVDVGLPEPALAATASSASSANDSRNDNAMSNHYDRDDDHHHNGNRNDKKGRKDKKAKNSRRHAKGGERKDRSSGGSGAEADLEAGPDEEMGFFFGLEVIPSGRYSVERSSDGTQRFRVLSTTPAASSGTTSSASASGTTTSSGREEEESNKDGKKKKKNKKRKKNDREDASPSAAARAKPADEASAEPTTTKRQRTSNKKDGTASAAEAEEEKTPGAAKAATPGRTERSEKNNGGARDDAATRGKDAEKKGSTTAAKKKKKKKRKKPKKDRLEEEEEDIANEEEGTAKPQESVRDHGVAEDDERVRSIQMAWLAATGGVSLDGVLCLSLADQRFARPTPVQAATLAAAILGRRNVVGAAPTGSGKTLAFLLPICQYLLEEEQEAEKEEEQSTTGNGDGDDGDGDDAKAKTGEERRRRRRRRSSSSSLPLQALILTPTRELALQTHKECEKLLPGSVGAIVGGLAHAKQARVLDKKRPPIVVGTPGRLWELMSSREHSHLNDLSQIRFLVIDEADRMIRQGAFPELSRILDAIQQANPMDTDDEDDDDDEDGEPDGDEDAPDRLFGLPGVRGEARVEMLSDEILQRFNQQRGEITGDAERLVREIADDEFEELRRNHDEAADSSEYDEDEISLPPPPPPPPPPPVIRRTYVYSATLTLPPSDSYVKSKKHVRGAVDVDGAIAEILEKSKAKGRTKVVDLSNTSRKKQGAKDAQKGKTEPEPARKEFCLPPGLDLKQIKCTQKHKDSHLYAYLMTTEQGSSGPCLVFCNSIAAVRRVGATLQALGIEVRVLHAQMQQRARFKAVESLKDGKSRKVVVSTDVAARGLDIPSVSSVVHYDVARTVDTFVHRSGRTARGFGEGAVGSSLSLIASGEDKSHARIVKALQVELDTIHLDGRLLTAAQERVNLACKVVSVDETERKKQREKQWFLDKASEAGLEVDDDDMFDDSAGDGDPKNRCRLREAENARKHLRVLLSEPMKTQRYGKFLSTNSAFAQKNVVEPVVVHSHGGRQRKRRRK